MNNIAFIALQAASEAFGNKLPDNWEDMTETAQNYWLDDNRTDKFDGLTTDEYFSLIDCHADTIVDAIKAGLRSAEKALVNAAIECTLPNDFNELDLPVMIGINT